MPEFFCGFGAYSGALPVFSAAERGTRRPEFGHYSWRNATMGSIAAARRAGR